MNTYKINELYIAAKDADSAFSFYLDETSSIYRYFGQLEENEEDEYIVKIRRLTNKEMNFAFITCCWDGCDTCDGKEEPVLSSPNEVIRKSEIFPCVICREE